MNIDKKIYEDFIKGNYRKNFKDLISLYKSKKNSDLANKIGVVLDRLKKINFSIFFYKKSIELDELNFKPYYNLAIIYKNNDYKKALQYINKAIKISTDPEIKTLKGSILLNLNLHDEIITLLENNLNSDEDYYILGQAYLAKNDLIKSEFCFKKSIANDNLENNVLYLNTFPRVYINSRQINYFRNKFRHQLQHLNNILNKKNFLEDETERALISSTNFYLSYQQKNDLKLNKEYYKILNKILKQKKNLENFYDFNVKKVCFISSFFYKHTVSKLFFNFIKEFALIKDLEIHLVHTSNISDEWTNEYKNLNLKYHKSVDYSQINFILKKEKFNSIFFLDHAMNNITQRILLEKKSKKYFMFWGHPVTSGCENVDYFISSNLMEQNSSLEYSENLILLDNIGFNFKLDNFLKNRSKKEINYDNTLYVMQSLFKLLPKYDQVYGKILSILKDYNIVFIEDRDPYYTKIFSTRLYRNKLIRQNFDRIKFLRRMTQNEFYSNLQNHKIILDSIGWSGGNTSVEALYFDKPIVCMTGNNLRSSHTCAILKFLNLDELIAKNYSQYINIAVELATNQLFYNQTVIKIKNNKNRLFDNKVSLYNIVKDLL